MDAAFKKEPADIALMTKAEKADYATQFILSAMGECAADPENAKRTLYTPDIRDKEFKTWYDFIFNLIN